MPAHRMGCLWKFKKDQVDAWVEAGGAAEPADKIAGNDFGRLRDTQRVNTKDGANQTAKKRKE